MTLDDRDKGRLLLVAIVTLLALPTIWLANRDRDDSGRPNVASVGIDPGEQNQTTPAPVDVTFDPMGSNSAGYLEQVPGVTTAVSVSVSHGTTPDQVIGPAMATYKNNDTLRASTCQYNGLSGGEDIIVVNVANSRSIECTTSALPGGDLETLVMAASKFQQIADLTAAPIHVEIRQTP